MKSTLEKEKVQSKYNRKFKEIFDSLDEAVIIISKESKQIEYVNTKFCRDFEKPILKKLENQKNKENDELMVESRSKISKMIKFIRKCFKTKNINDEN